VLLLVDLQYVPSLHTLLLLFSIAWRDSLDSRIAKRTQAGSFEEEEIEDEEIEDEATLCTTPSCSLHQHTS